MTCGSLDEGTDLTPDVSELAGVVEWSCPSHHQDDCDDADDNDCVSRQFHPLQSDTQTVYTADWSLADADRSAGSTVVWSLIDVMLKTVTDWVEHLHQTMSSAATLTCLRVSVSKFLIDDDDAEGDCFQMMNTENWIETCNTTKFIRHIFIIFITTDALTFRSGWV